MILTAILKLVWLIFIQGPLNLIAAFNNVLEYLTGGIITDMLFGSSKKFEWNTIPMQFWWFVIVSLCVFALVFAIQMIILIFKETVESKTKFILAIQNAVKAFTFMFLIPIFFFIANFIVQSLANLVINHFGDNNNIAQYLYRMGDPTWNGSAAGVPYGYGAPDNIRDYNMMAELFGTWFMLFVIFLIGVTMVQKVIELFFLFILSPIVMIVMVVDDGKAAMTWKNMVIAKFLAATGTLIGYYIFMSATQILISSGLHGLNTANFVRSLFIILFLCGGGLATMSFADIIAAFVGEGIGIRESYASMKSTFAAGGIAMGAAKMTGKAIGFAKNKRAEAGLANASSTISGLSGANSSGIGGEAKRNFASYYNATTGLSSRSGILGLAGLAIGTAAIGISNFNRGRKENGFKGGAKEFGKGMKRAAVAPFVNLKKNFGLNVFKNKKKHNKSDKI